MESEEILVQRSKLLISHTVFESPFPSVMQNRDTVDKRFKFVNNGKVYTYRSTCSSVAFPKKHDMVRLEMIFAISEYSIKTLADGRKYINQEILS